MYSSHYKVLRSIASTDTTIGQRYSFSMRAFDHNNYQVFQAECDALRQLKECPDIANYLGCYEEKLDPSTFFEDRIAERQKVTSRYNILFNHVESDLEEYFIDNLPPITLHEMGSFWIDLFNVAFGIESIHDHTSYNKGYPERFAG